MGSTKPPQHPGYVKMEDTPWITQAREIADKGGKGVLENYNKVNVFDDATNKSLEARNNATYKRAFDDMARQYKDSMNRYAAANYNQFGTLNATPAAYRTDMANLQAQRQLDDLAYNQAMNYDTLRDNELQRRYNTLDMLGNMYQYGQIPYTQDLKNWNIENTNRNLMYENELANYKNRSGGWQGALKGGLSGAASGFLATGNPWGALAGGVGGAIGGAL